MRTEIIGQTILAYLRHLNDSDWIFDEAYKFEFANFVLKNVDFEKQSDNEILSILKKSQSIKYDRSTGVQFIQKSAKEALSKFIDLQDVELFRHFKTSRWENINWNERSMSYTGLSAWLATLFPDKFYPVPATGFDQTFQYLFGSRIEKFPKRGEKYILACQDYMNITVKELIKYPLKEIHLKVWNRYYKENEQLNIEPKNDFEQIDWIWLAQDFHLFVLREVLKNNKPDKTNKNTEQIIEDDFEPVGIEGKSKLAQHMRLERDAGFIKKVKERAYLKDPFLRCEVCGFSFFEKYGELGHGFIEAHHKRLLSETRETLTKEKDIALVCSNCHRMIHRGILQIENEGVLTIEEFRKLINQ